MALLESGREEGGVLSSIPHMGLKQNVRVPPHKPLVDVPAPERSLGGGKCTLDAVPVLTWSYQEKAQLLTLRDVWTNRTVRARVVDTTSLINVYPPDRELVMAFLRNALEQDTPLQCEFRYMRSGRPVPVCAVGAPVRIKSTERMVIGIALDAFDFSHEESRIRAGERVDSVHKFAGVLAHELHNPLAAVTNALYLLTSNVQLGSEARQFLDVANASVDRVNRITKFLLSLYDDQEIRRAVVVERLVESAVEECMKESRTVLHVNRRYEPTPKLEVFEQQLQRAITAVLRNAAESCPSECRLSVHTFSRYSWHAGAGRGVWIVSADNGPGVPIQIRKRLGEPFVTTKPEPGRGLGLWGAKWIVRKHNGVLLIHSSNNSEHCGTSVGIFIPESA